MQIRCYSYFFESEFRLGTQHHVDDIEFIGVFCLNIHLLLMVLQQHHSDLALVVSGTTYKDEIAAKFIHDSNSSIQIPSEWDMSEERYLKRKLVLLTHARPNQPLF